MINSGKKVVMFSNRNHCLQIGCAYRTESHTNCMYPVQEPKFFSYVPKRESLFLNRVQSLSKSFESRVIASIDEYTLIVKQNSEHTTACYKNRYLVYLNSSVNMILFYEWSRQFRVMKRVEIKYFNAKYICHLFQIRLSVSDCHLLICYGLLNPINRRIM